MAWEWVGPTATAAVGIAGIAAALFSGARQQSTALNAAQKGIDGALAKDREEREQRRLENAYLELFAYLSRQNRWARSVRPFWGQPEPPPPLDPGQFEHIESLVTAYGSDRVLKLLQEWGKWAAKIEDADVTIRMEEKSPNPSREMSAEAASEHRAISSYKEEMQAADKRIRDQARRELRLDGGV